MQAGAPALSEWKWKRRLAQYGRHHCFVNHERQREVARKAHTDRADPPAAELGVELRQRARSQSVIGLDSCAASSRNSLLMQTRAESARAIYPAGDRFARRAKHDGHRDREPRVGDPCGKRRYPRVNPGNLMHDNHARSRTPTINRTRQPSYVNESSRNPSSVMFGFYKVVGISRRANRSTYTPFSTDNEQLTRDQ